MIFFSKNKIRAEDKKDIAAALQKCTIDLIIKLLKSLDEMRHIENICFSGLASFNIDLLKEIERNFSDVKIHIPDQNSIDEISIGAARYIWHIVLDNKRHSCIDLPSNSKLMRMRKDALINISESLGLDISYLKTKKEIISAIDDNRAR